MSKTFSIADFKIEVEIYSNLGQVKLRFSNQSGEMRVVLSERKKLAKALEHLAICMRNGEGYASAIGHSLNMVFYKNLQTLTFDIGSNLWPAKVGIRFIEKTECDEMAKVCEQVANFINMTL
jgi:hypothetical protein